MKTPIPHFCTRLIVGLAVALPLVGGCSFFTAPPVEPIPTPVPTPKPGLFNPADYNIAGIALNKAGDEKLPEYFQIVRIDSGEIFWARSVDIQKIGTAPNQHDQAIYGAPDVMRLAGVITPQKGQPGFSEMMSTLQHWTLGRKLTIEQDSQFPLDLDSRRRVQIFFPGGKDGTTSLNLNRMMIRSGYAVVDVNSPTVFDTKGWLNDEEYARQNRLGLWKLGIILQQRQPPPPIGAKKVGADAEAKVDPPPAPTPSP